MDITELDTLSSCTAVDFDILRVVGKGQSGLVVSATCNREGHPDPAKLYAIKLLYNFTHEYTSVVRNAYENEWLVLSRLLPHPNIVRFWSQFVSVIPPSFSQNLPADKQRFSTHKNRSGQIVPSKGQFLVLDFHCKDLCSYLSKLSMPLAYETTLKLAEQLLDAVLFLEKNLIRHLDLKLANVLITEYEEIKLCDFGCAVQFSDSKFALRYVHGMLPGGNKAHLAPEVLSAYHKLQQNFSKCGTIDYSLQASFAVGVLITEISTLEHPLPDYPLGYMNNRSVCYSNEDIIPVPSSYPNSFASIIQDLLHADPNQRMPLSEALQQLRVCCLHQRQRESSLPSAGSPSVGEIERVKQERDMALAKLKMVAAERDFAVGEMREMAEQCQSVAEEFQSMADDSERMVKEISKLRSERDSAVKACESACEANELLREQLSLITRERDLGRQHIAELKELTSKFSSEENILECRNCNKFYLQSECGEELCHWHAGVSYFCHLGSSYYHGSMYSLSCDVATPAVSSRTL